MHYVYVMRHVTHGPFACYVGETTNMWRRAKEHFTGHGGVKATTTYPVTEILAVYMCEKRSDARRIEILLQKEQQKNPQWLPPEQCCSFISEYAMHWVSCYVLLSRIYAMSIATLERNLRKATRRLHYKSKSMSRDVVLAAMGRNK